MEHGNLLPPVDSNFEVQVIDDARGTVLVVSGELDVASSQTLEQELAKLPHSGTIVVDLRTLSFIDSTGLGVIVHWHQVAKEEGRRFGLVRAGGQVDRLLSLTGLQGELLMGDSPDELLAAE